MISLDIKILYSSISKLERLKILKNKLISNNNFNIKEIY